MRLLLAVGILISVGVAVAMPARAARPSSASSIALNETDPHLGSVVTFTTQAALKGNEWGMVAVFCEQGTTKVYGSLSELGHPVLLGGGSSIWLQVGGAADCTAGLWAYAFTGAGETIRPLAQTTFHAEG